MSTTIRRATFISTVLLILLLASSTAVMAEKKVSKKAFTFTQETEGVIDWGIWTYHGNGKIIRFRDMIWLHYVEASDTRLAGYIKWISSGQVDASWNGSIWGTFQSCDESGEPVADGWQGMWNGQYFYWPPDNFIMKAVAHGIGANEGLKFEATSVVAPEEQTGDPIVAFGVGVIQDNNK